MPGNRKFSKSYHLQVCIILLNCNLDKVDKKIDNLWTCKLHDAEQQSQKGSQDIGWAKRSGLTFKKKSSEQMFTMNIST